MVCIIIAYLWATLGGNEEGDFIYSILVGKAAYDSYGVWVINLLLCGYPHCV